MSSAISPYLDTALPPLDLHAHIDPTVTTAQLATLGNAIVFAVTRTTSEAAAVVQRNDARVVWGVGVHPGRPDALDGFDARGLEELASRLGFIGEIGLDRKLQHPRAIDAFAAALHTARSQRRLCSIHSTGRQQEVVDAIGSDGTIAILHWFTGNSQLIERAAQAGCYFSINASMSNAQIRALPVERLLPETDFPFTKKAGASRPGDIASLENRCVELLGMNRDEVRHLWYRNLRAAYVSLAGGLSAAPAVLHRSLATA